VNRYNSSIYLSPQNHNKDNISCVVKMHYDITVV